MYTAKSGTFKRHAKKNAFSKQRSNTHRPERGQGCYKKSVGRKPYGRMQHTFNPSQFINTNPVEYTEDVYTPVHTFETFGLSENIVRNLTSLGLTVPTPIQDQTIPHIMKGTDITGLAETGTGKTAAFLVPLIHQTLENPKKHTLILAPTRELVLQIAEELRTLSRGMKIFHTTCVGGMNIRPQIAGLRRTNHFVIATPGRMLDLIRRKHYRPEQATAVVLDEADRMLDMGFIADIRSILSLTPKDRETLLFSATMNAKTKEIVNDFLRNPVTVSVKKKDAANSIEQDVVRYGHNKFDTLLTLLKTPACTRVIIFGSMKHSVEKLSQELKSHGIKAESIHGNKNHNQRQKALSSFKQGTAHVLVATDVAARGIHVDNVSHVINYDLPSTFEDYIHRIGRTGRGNKRGKALTFIA